MYHHVRSFVGVNGSFAAGISSGAGYFTIQKFFGESNCQLYNFIVDTLLLNPGFSFEFGGNITIRALWNANGVECINPVYLVGVSGNVTIRSGCVVNLEYAHVLNLNVTGQIPVLTNQAVNLGGNRGISFANTQTSRTLFWVGGSGSWNDATHWSFSNDGVYPPITGGCIPSLYDNVIFNENSGFDSSESTVQVSSYSTYCKNLSVINTDSPLKIINGTVKLYGSLDLQDSLGAVLYISFNSDEAEFIRTSRSVLEGYFEGIGSYELLDDSQWRGISLKRGGLISNGNNVEANYILSGFYGRNFRLDISGSQVIVHQRWEITSNGDFNASESEIFIHGTFVSNSNQNYNRVIVENENINSFNIVGPFHATYLSVFSSANFSGSNSFDTLVFRPGKTYQLQAGREQIVNRQLYASGSPCEVIQINSTASGSPAKFSVLGGTNTFDYSRVKDIDASNSFDVVNFESHSVNMGGNTNMSFIPYDANSPILGLGEDQTLPCPFTSYRITNEGFYGNPLTTYLWSDGSTNDHLEATEFGLYTVTTSYSTGCSVVDSIRIKPLADVIPPVIIDCPSNITVTTDQDLCSSSVSWSPPTATDLCQLDSLVSNYDSGDVFEKGVTTVTYTAYDASLNSAMCSFTITVEDEQLPQILNCPSNQSVTAAAGTCTATVSWVVPTFVDNCSSMDDLMVSSSNDPGDLFSLGTTTVSYTIEDLSGNTSSCSFTILVSGAVAPIVSNCPADISLNAMAGTCATTVSWIEPTAVEGCSGNAMNYLVRSHAPGTSFPVAVTPVAYLYEDTQGNLGYCVFNVTVIDTEVPVFSDCPNDISVNESGISCGAVVNWVSPTASDNCGTPTVVSTSLPSGSVFPGGTTNVIYTAVDGSGNTSVCSFSVTVIDVTPPVVAGCPSDISVSSTLTSCNATAFWIPPTASDNCGANLSMTASHNPGSLFLVGTTLVTYSFSDGINTSTCSFVVSVEDNVVPVFSNCPTNIDLVNEAATCQAVVTWIPPSATDFCAGGMVNMTSTHSPGELFSSGVTIVTYTATNSNGTTSTCSFEVNVEDIESPIINISSLPTKVCLGDSIYWIDTITDNCGIDTIIYSHPKGSILPLGLTTITIIAIDFFGNNATHSFHVNVHAAPNVPEVSNLPIETCTTTDVLLSVTNPSYNLLYSWIHNGLFVNVGPDLTLKMVEMLHQGIYTVIAEDPNGCSSQSEVLLSINECDILIPESFSPNNDGNNDVFFIPNLTKYPETKIWINNRWGVQVFQSDNYQNDWNGHSNSSITVGNGVLPEGTYYYILQLGGEDTQPGSGTVYKGFVYLKP